MLLKEGSHLKAPLKVDKGVFERQFDNLNSCIKQCASYPNSPILCTVLTQCCDHLYTFSGQKNTFASSGKRVSDKLCFAFYLCLANNVDRASFLYVHTCSCQFVCTHHDLYTCSTCTIVYL